MASTSAADYPALSFDPAPGDVDAVEEAASTARSVMRTREGVAEALGGAPVAGWHGALATAFDDLVALELEPMVETIVQVARDHGMGPDDFAVLDGLEEVTDADGKSSSCSPTTSPATTRDARRC